MDFKDYSAEDFALNKRFRKWILNPQKEDHLYWEEYLKKHPHQVDVIVEAKKLIQNLPYTEFKLTSGEKALLWQSIQRDVEKKNDENPERNNVYPINSDTVIKKISKNKKAETSLFYVKRALVAAAVLLFVTISWGIYQQVFKSNNKPEEITVEIIYKQNPWGQKSTVFLSDGTEVILNSGSSLKYAKEFAAGERVVYLQGEAFFKVAKDLQRPFRVISKNISTTALGTSFNVRAFPRENNVNISLVSGKVLVSSGGGQSKNADREVILEPGEQASFNELNRQIVKETFDPSEVISWKEGVIYFKDADASEVFGYLEKWYGVEIREMNNPSTKWNYTGEFNNMDLHNVLASIGYTMNFEFKKEDKIVKIKYLNE